MSKFNFETTAEQAIAGISLAGKRALITGASSGLGVETSRALASAGASVVMVARNKEKLDVAVATVLKTEPQAQIDTLIMDLADLDFVRNAAADALQRFPRIDLLINNAGVMACPLARTAQGFEMQFGTNHLGHFLFTCLLAPSLVAGAPSRVVNLSSAGHRLACVNFDDPNYQGREYNKWQAYGESKTANVLFSVGLEERLGPQGVHALAVHPGVIMTELSRHLQPEDYETLMASRPNDEPMVYKSTEQGSATSIRAATAPELEGRGGLYLENCQIAKPAEPGGEGGVESYALDTASAQRLWQLSEALVGQRFEF